MAGQNPIFIDQFGTTSTQNQTSPGPWWKDGWQGKMQLWKAFWVCFVFGHGIVIGLGLGLMMVAMVLGFAVDAGSLDAGFTGLATGGTVLVLVYLTFVVWAVVTVWRAADNCVDKGWGLMARLAMVSYGICLILPFAVSLFGRTG